jgi:uncharacterized protein YacL
MQQLLEKIFQNPDIVALSIAVTVSVLLMSWWHYKTDVRFDIKDIIIDTATGKVSLYKIGQIVALIISTWIIVHETKSNRLSEWLFLSYMAIWSGTNLAKAIIEKNNTKNNEVSKTSIEYTPKPKYSEEPVPNQRYVEEDK